MENEIEQLARHLKALEAKGGKARVEMPFAHGIIIIAQVQLALRHPQNTGLQAECARTAIEAWIRCYDKASPGMGDLLRLGFDPEHDLPTLIG